MKTKILALSAVAALAVPAAAQAGKPSDPGKHGRDNAAQKQSASKKSTPRTQKVGFSLSGLLVQGETFPTFTATGDRFTVGTFELDLLSANKHARSALGIQKSAITGTGVTTLDDFAANDSFRLVVEGITDTANDGFSNDLAAGDRVHVIGKVTRTRNAREQGEKQTYTWGAIDIRKIVVTRGDDS